MSQKKNTCYIKPVSLHSKLNGLNSNSCNSVNVDYKLSSLCRPNIKHLNDLPDDIHNSLDHNPVKAHLDCITKPCQSEPKDSFNDIVTNDHTYIHDCEYDIHDHGNDSHPCPCGKWCTHDTTCPCSHKSFKLHDDLHPFVNYGFGRLDSLKNIGAPKLRVMYPVPLPILYKFR